LDAAMALDPKEREELAEDLWQSIPLELSPEQIMELERRVEALDRGEVQTIPGEQVMRDIRQRLRR
jgi:putative addiction module component (TIGR02574 family)